MRTGRAQPRGRAVAGVEEDGVERPSRPVDRAMESEDRVAKLTPDKRALLRQRLQGPLSDGHASVARSFKALGITHVFGVPGHPLYETFSALVKHGIRPIGMRQQQAAALAALSYNYFAGEQKAALVVSSGAGVTNALTGILVAHDNCWPLLVLGGNCPQAARDKGYFMAADAASLCRPVTKWAATVASTETLPAAIAEAFEIAQSGRPGPVFLDLPEDIVTGAARSSCAASAKPPAPVPPNLEEVERAFRCLAAAKRPLLVIGKGLRWSAPFAELQALVNRARLPFITSPIGRGTLPDDHPLCLNPVHWRAQSEADVVVVLGARLDWTFRYGSHIADSAILIQVDIHAPEFGRNRAANLAICADVGGFIRALRGRFESGQNAGPGIERDEAWIDGLQRERQSRIDIWEGRSGDDSVPISPYRLARELREALPHNTALILDSSLTMAVCQRVIPAREPVARLTPGSSGCLGVGVPFAIGAKLCDPRRPVVAVCGDFAFGLSAMEMETAMRYRLPIVVVVANNDGNLGLVRQHALFPADHPDRITAFQPGLRYEQITQTFGGYGEYVEHPAQIAPALRRALSSGVPACVNVRTDPHAPYPRD